MSKTVRRLVSGFVPEHYQLELAPDREAMKMQGTVVITGRKLGRPSQRLTFHQHNLRISTATLLRRDKKGEREVAVARINHHKTLNEVRLHADELLYPGEYEVRLTFESKIIDGMHGVYRCKYELNGQKAALVATQFESHHAREAFPCIDEPEAKATFDLTLVIPKNETGLSNTAAKTTEKRGDAQAITFETTPKMSTYLLAFVYGELQHRAAKTTNGVDVRVWSTKVHPPEALDFGLDVAKRTIEFFDEYFGVPYPLSKCDHVALPDFSVGAMENWGLITYREACLLADPATASQSSRETVAVVVAHETSHQWFGNLVTMRWWDNLWLNESFANVMEYRAIDALFPDWHVWDNFIIQEGLSAIRRDAIAGVQAIQTPVHHPDEINTLFDPSIVYAKGGRLLRMLMEYIGEEAFCRGLKAYFTQHAYANTTGDDLWKALSEASGKNVAALMQPWIAQSGFPVVSVTQAGAKLTLKQEQFSLGAKPAKDRVWPVPLLSSRTDIPRLLTKSAQDVALQSDEFVRLNEGALGHYIVNYTRPEHAATIAALVTQERLAPAERLMLLSDSSMLARAGAHSFAATLQLLENYTTEKYEPVWDMMTLILADARRFVDLDKKLDGAIKKLVRQLIATQFARLGWQEKSGESAQDIKLRALIVGLGIYAEEESIYTEAVRLFEKYQQDADAVPAELRSLVFGAAVRRQVPGAFDYLLQLDRDTANADLKYDIASGLSDTRDADQCARLLERLKDSEQVRLQDLTRWIVYLLRNRWVRAQAWQWLRDNWKWIEDIFDGDKTYDSFPRYAANCFNTSQLLAEYKAFFEPQLDDLVLARNIRLGIEELQSRVDWLERDLSSVQKYFE